MKHFFRFLFGSITVSVSGNTERFLSALSRSGIRYWSLKSKSPGTAQFCIYRRNFKSLVPIRRQSHSHIHIIRRSGVPHLLRNYKKRLGIAVGAVIFIITFFIFSFFIWRIEVSGCKSTTVYEVLESLEQLGFSKGSIKSSFVIREIENEFLKNNSKYSWISINIKGTTAYIEVNEAVPKPDIIDTSEPCSIYAARDGVIASVTSFMGYSVVSPGDTVTAGDLVVSGNYTDKYGVEYKLHSYAKVMAYTVHANTVTVPYTEKVHVPTGKVKNKYSIKLIRFTIPLYFSKKISYNNYDTTQSEKILSLGNNFALPFSVIKNTYTEFEPSVCTKSKEAALADAYEQLYDFEYNLAGITVTDRSYQETDNGDSITVKVTLECYEDIGIKGKID